MPRQKQQRAHGNTAAILLLFAVVVSAAAMVVPDELSGKNSTEFKLSLHPTIFAGRNLEDAATFLLDSVVSPALKKLRVPVGTYTRLDDDESPTLLQFFDSTCWRIRDAHNILRLRSYKYVESGDPKRKADFSYKHRVTSEAGMVHQNMDTALLTPNQDYISQCGRHDYKRELVYPSKVLWQTVRSFRTDDCTDKLLDIINGSQLATAGEWGAAFPGLGFASNDITPIYVYKETWQSKIYIGGDKNSEKYVFLCSVQRNETGDCPHGNTLKTKMIVEAWYDSLNTSDADSFVAAELRWDAEQPLNAVNYDSDALFSLLREEYGDFFVNGTKTSALFGVKPRSCTTVTGTSITSPTAATTVTAPITTAEPSFSDADAVASSTLVSVVCVILIRNLYP